jgi:hypothetical protein
MLLIAPIWLNLGGRRSRHRAGAGYAAAAIARMVGG